MSARLRPKFFDQYMKNKYFLPFFVFLFIFFLAGKIAQAQYNQIEFKDTLQKEYPYIFPILGAKVYEKGAQLPLPWGVMLNSFYGRQGVILDNLNVGFQSNNINVPLTDVDRIVNFNKINASALSINVRPDLWVLPFWNVYGVIGKTYTTTEVQLDYPVDLYTLVNVDGYTYGFGNTLAFGFGPVFAVIDGNWTWTDLENLEQPVNTNVLSIRIGNFIKFKKSKKDAGIALWAGAMRVRTGGTSYGTIKISEVFPNSPEEVDRIVNEYWEWYGGLDPLDPKKVIAEKVFNPIIDNIANSAGTGEILYSFDKRPAQEWNMIVGGQYQIDPRWQLRFEVGVLGERKQALLSFNYRFGIRKFAGQKK
jgi:hypothetical protein